MKLKVKGITFLIDDEYEDFIKSHKWNISFYGYLINEVGLMFHRYVIGAQKGQIVDHKNLDITDNRKQNLRITDKSGNSMNRKKMNKKTSSKFKGVSWQLKRKKWRAYIVLNDIQYHLGEYTSEIDAARAYNDGAIKYFGEFAYLNKVDE
jgi:hypothetical protein